MRKTLIAFLAILPFVASCDMFVTQTEVSEEMGEIHISFDGLVQTGTRASDDVPDTDEFILTVTSADDKEIYRGLFCESPESMMVAAGSYSVKIVSSDFTRPAFSSPQYGDEQCVVVKSGEVADVRLECCQINSGVRLKIDPDFLNVFPDGALFLSSQDGKLMYSYSEKRYAYFLPGKVSLIMSRGGSDETLMSKTLLAREMLVLDINVSGSESSSKESLVVSVDTTRTWLSEGITIGGEGYDGSESEAAFSVTDAKSAVGKEKVWVCGYIVGGDMSSTSASFEGPFSSRTHMMIGPRSNTSNRSSCLSVELPSGKVRDALNLVDHPELLGKKVYLKGNIVSSYYGIEGLKKTSDYEL